MSNRAGTDAVTRRRPRDRTLPARPARGRGPGHQHHSHAAGHRRARHHQLPVDVGQVAREEQLARLEGETGLLLLVLQRRLGNPALPQSAREEGEPGAGWRAVHGHPASGNSRSPPAERTASRALTVSPSYGQNWPA